MSIPKVSIRQLKAARSLLGWLQDDVAKASGVSIPTVKRLEAADGDLGGRPATAAKIVAALEAAGIEFLNHGQPGVRLRPSAFDHPKPRGPATDAVEGMEEAISRDAQKTQRGN